MDVVISNETQLKEIHVRIDNLQGGKRTEEQDRELADLLAAVSTWEFEEKRRVKTIKNAEDYDRAKARVAELSDKPEGTTEAVELGEMVEALRQYESSQRDPLNDAKPGRLATP